MGSSSIETIGGLLRAAAADRPAARFCAVGEKCYSFAEIDQRSDAVTAAFACAGVAAGDRVAVLTPNRPEMVELFFGLAKLGAVQVPLNAYLKGAFLRHQLADSRSSVAVLDADGLSAVAPLLADLPELRQLVLLDDPPGERLPIAQQSYADLVSTCAPAPEIEITSADTMSIVYTSGTTGLPKGCVLSHGYYIRSARVAADGVGINPDDVLYTSLPLFHIGARTMVLTAALLRGVPVTLDPGFSARSFIPRAREVGATIIIGIGAMGKALLATAPAESDTNHRIHTMMIAPMSPAVQEEYQSRFGIDPWTEIYGQTECTPLCVSPRSGARDRAGCGAPAPDLELELRGDDGREVPAGEVGEICIRPLAPDAMFDGYWDGRSGVSAVFKDGWFETGDLARQLPSGELRFADRKKDALRRRGENVSSIEVEAAILAHPAVAEVAIHAVPSPQSEDDIKACIVLAAGSAISPADAFDHFSANLPYFAIPRYVEIVDALPRNAVGRVMKHVLRDRGHSDDVWDLDALGYKVAVADRRKITQPLGAK